MPERILSPSNITEMSKSLSETRTNYIRRVEDACAAARRFAESAALAIGDVSVEEAENATVDVFSETLNK